MVFDNGSEFKRDFVPLLKDFDVILLLASIKNPQSNAPMERVHQVLYNKIVTKDLDGRTFGYINPGEEKSSAQLHGQQCELRISQHLIKHLDNLSLDMTLFLTSLQSSTGKQ